jgi:hypothetical protein
MVQRRHLELHLILGPLFQKSEGVSLSRPRPDLVLVMVYHGWILATNSQSSLRREGDFLDQELTDPTRPNRC